MYQNNRFANIQGVPKLGTYKGRGLTLTVCLVAKRPLFDDPPRREPFKYYLAYFFRKGGGAPLNSANFWQTNLRNSKIGIFGPKIPFLAPFSLVLALFGPSEGLFGPFFGKKDFKTSLKSLWNICQVCIQQLDLFLPMTWSNRAKGNEKSTLSNGGEGCMVLLSHSSSLDA